MRLSVAGLSIAMMAMSLTMAVADKDDAPPEWSEVTGRLKMSESSDATGGVVWFVPQRRLMEIPRSGSLERVKALAEGSAAVNDSGKFSVKLPPGNFLLIYDPSAERVEASDKPGADSLGAGGKPTPEQIEKRRAAIMDNAANGPAVEGSRLENAYVIWNRYVRPPKVEYGDMLLGARNTVKVTAKKDGEPVANVALRLRGRNGEVYDPEPRRTREQAQVTFFDVLPQTYQVLAEKLPAPPGSADDSATTPTVVNPDFAYEGKPISVTVNLK